MAPPRGLSSQLRPSSFGTPALLRRASPNQVESTIRANDVTNTRSGKFIGKNSHCGELAA
jgi:hypothetical protein